VLFRNGRNIFRIMVLAAVFPGGTSLCGGSVEERAENLRLQRENAALRQQLQKNDAEIKRLQQELLVMHRRYRNLDLWMASVADTGKFVAAGDREGLLLEHLKELSRRGTALALQSSGFCEDMRGVIGKLPIGAAQQARLSLKLDEIDSASRNFIAVSEPPAADPITLLQQSRILAVNRELKVVVLSVGSVDGVAMGMVFKNHDASTELKIIETRAKVAAAIVSRGDIAAVRIGEIFSPLDIRSSAAPIALPGVTGRLK